MQDTQDVDQFLVSAIRSGDQRAWRQLIDRYQGRLLAFARTRLRGPGEAEDALQETLLGFVTSLAHFDAARSLETYLFAILRYKIGEILTRKNRRREIIAGFDVDDDAPGIFDPSSGETPSQAADRHERTRQQTAVLAKILRRLIEEFRDRDKLDDLKVIELLFFVGLRNRDAGARVGRDEKAVAGVKFRALNRLREYLDDLPVSERDLLQAGSVSSEATICRVWRDRRLSCLKRSTLGAHVLGVLEDPWASYAAFHVEDIGCLMCRANLDDLSRESERVGDELTERMFQSSVGFLSRSRP